MAKLSPGGKHVAMGLLFGTAFGMALSAVLRSKYTASEGVKKQQREAVRPKVICFGDSLTQYGFDAERLGWLSLLAHWWERRFDVVNRGFSGYNTRWLMPLMDRLFVPGGSTPVKLVTIFLGANDCVLPGNAQYVPLQEYKENLKLMAAHVRTVHNEARLMLITPPPIHERKWMEHRQLQARDMDRKQEATKSYAMACAEVGEEIGAKVVDAYRLMGSGAEDAADEYLHDGVHFTAEGNRRLFEGVKAEIRASFPELVPDTEEEGGVVSMQAPHFSEVDPTNPRDSVLRGL
ncbi:unnamed protein product [Ectocarpus sp. 6 AP-2014]